MSSDFPYTPEAEPETPTAAQTEAPVETRTADEILKTIQAAQVSEHLDGRPVPYAAGHVIGAGGPVPGGVLPADTKPDDQAAPELAEPGTPVHDSGDGVARDISGRPIAGPPVEATEDDPEAERAPETPAEHEAY